MGGVGMTRGAVEVTARHTPPVLQKRVVSVRDWQVVSPCKIGKAGWHVFISCS